MNIVTIVPTQFTDVRTGKYKFGWRAYDDEGQAYDNTWNRMTSDNRKFLFNVLSRSDDKTLWNMIDYVERNTLGISIDSDFLSWEVVKKVLEKVRRDKK